MDEGTMHGIFDDVDDREFTSAAKKSVGRAKRYQMQNPENTG